MGKILLLSIIAAAFPSLASAQQGRGAPKDESVEQTLTRLDRELTEAAVRGDASLSERTELDGFVFVSPDGGVEGKERDAKDGAPKYESIQTDDVRVRVHGDTAILTGRAAVRGKLADGEDISGQYRYMRVFVKQQGAWRLAAGSAVLIQQLPMPPTPPTPPVS